MTKKNKNKRSFLAFLKNKEQKKGGKNA